MILRTLMTFSSSASSRSLGSRGTTDADQPLNPAVPFREDLINSGTAYTNTKATILTRRNPLPPIVTTTL
jgi:hypothetical protein